MHATINRFQSRVHEWHLWKDQQGWLQSLVIAMAWVPVMAILAQVRFVLPFTPVPITMQVFGVYLGAILLGRNKSIAAQALYVGLGIAGMQWFQDYNGGWAYFLGPTGGYLLAYPFASWVTAELLERRQNPIVAMLAGLLIIYALGVAWLAWSLDVSLTRAIMLGAAPFIVVDLVKAVVAAGMGRPFLARNS